MIRISTGDLVQIEFEGIYYYVLILGKICMFGGQLCFAYHRTSKTPLSVAEVLEEPVEGFPAIVDFIWAKREKRIERLAKKMSVDKFLDGAPFCLNGKPHFKSTHRNWPGKAERWWVYDAEGNIVNDTKALSEQEKCYPNYSRIDDTIMVDLVDKRWKPEYDDRI